MFYKLEKEGKKNAKNENIIISFPESNFHPHPSESTFIFPINVILIHTM